MYGTILKEKAMRKSRASPSALPCRRLHCPAAVLFALALGVATLAQAQGVENYDAERKHAFELFDKNRMLEALPILERLAAAKPKDIAVHEWLGFAILWSSATMKDLEAQKQTRARARWVLLEAKALGDNSPDLLNTLDGLPEDGSLAAFSSRKEVDEAMREGEVAFARGELEAARGAYERALLLDPKMYDAALFIGDVHFQQNHLETAGEWYARAIAIDPDRDAAYRFWGDALMKLGQIDNARDEFIEAIVANLYSRKSWSGLLQWAKQKNVTLSHPQIESPNRLEFKDGRTTITINRNTLGRKDGMSAWISYELSRTLWRKGSFAKEFPQEKEYRHSLQEEADALGAVARMLASELKTGKIKKLDPSLSSLLKLYEDGLLEAYILIAKADEGIAQDYVAYRAAHRDHIRRYIAEWVIPQER